MGEPFQAKVQVKPGHYGPGYDDWDKWTNYYWQTRCIFDYGLENILEIGVGSKVVTNYLRGNGVNLTTLDIDPHLKPDHVGSATALPFEDHSFDGVLCAEVL